MTGKCWSSISATNFGEVFYSNVTLNSICIIQAGHKSWDGFGRMEFDQGIKRRSADRPFVTRKQFSHLASAVGWLQFTYR